MTLNFTSLASLPFKGNFYFIYIKSTIGHLKRKTFFPKFFKSPIINICAVLGRVEEGGRTGLVVRASDSGSGDPGSILDRVGVLFP